MKNIYIGDGVYVTFDGFGVWLRTQRGSVTHEVYLEPKMVGRIMEIITP